MPNLSIIIPHYNTPKLLKKLLDTIPYIDDIQVLVIDDNSNIDTLYYNELQIRNTNVTFLRNYTSKNSAGTCRNIGLRHAIGRWVLFADADDFFVNDFYKTVSEYFDTTYDIVFFAPTSVDIRTNKISNRHIDCEMLVKASINNSNNKNMLRLKHCFLSPCSKLISRKLIVNNRIMFDEILAHEDVMFSTMLGYYATKIFGVEKTIYTITLRNASLTTSVNERKIFEGIGVFIQRYDFLRKNIPKKDFRLLDISGGNYFFAALRNRYPLKMIFKIIVLLKKNRIRIFRRKYLNPMYMFNRLKKYNIKYGKDYYKYKQ